MHIFPRYAAQDPGHAAELVRSHPFALVVSGDATGSAGAPTATHAPVVLSPGEPSGDSLVGATLLGHIARANPQWHSFAGGPEVLVVFSGPHGYVSPTTYARAGSVPTWNYAAVHLTGRVELVDGHKATLAVLEETVRALESLRSTPWDMSESRERFNELVSGVSAFRVRVTQESSMFKLGQDLPDELHARVVAELTDAERPDHALAELMRRYKPDSP